MVQIKNNHLSRDNNNLTGIIYTGKDNDYERLMYISLKPSNSIEIKKDKEILYIEAGLNLNQSKKIHTLVRNSDPGDARSSEFKKKLTSII